MGITVRVVSLTSVSFLRMLFWENVSACRFKMSTFRHGESLIVWNEKKKMKNRIEKKRNWNLIKTTSQQICARYYCARDGISLSPFLAKIFFNNPDSQTRGPIIFKSLIRIPLYMYISRPADSFQPTAAIPRGNSHFVQQLIQFFRFVEPIGEPREIPPICPPRIIECHRDPNTLPVATSMRVQAYFSHTNQQHETI